MRNQRNYPVIMILTLAAGLTVLALITYGNYQLAQQNPGGNHFLMHWMGTRALLSEGENPYTEEVAEAIQTAAYGRPAQPGEAQLRAVYPLYAVIVFFPFSFISDFDLARAIWMTLLEVALGLLLFFSLRLTRWRTGLAMLVILMLFSLLWYYGLQPILNGNVVILVALLLFGGVLAIRGGADELAGVLFAFSTIKPNVVILALAFIAFWAMNKGRWRIVGWMTATVILLAASAALLIPTWFIDNVRELLQFTSINPPGTPRAIFSNLWPAWGERVGWALTGVMAIILLVEWVANRRVEFDGFFWTVCLTLAAGQWIGIYTGPDNFIILLPGLVLVFSLFDDRWRTFGRFFVILSMILLLAVPWVIALEPGDPLLQPVHRSALFFSLPAYLLVTLYWVRWWAIRPPTVWYDMLEGR